MPTTEMTGEFSFLKYSFKVLTDYWIAVRNSTFIGVSFIENELCWSWAAYATLCNEKEGSVHSSCVTHPNALQMH